MNFSLTCLSCNRKINMDASSSVESLRCPHCNDTIQLRRGRMQVGDTIKSRYKTLYKVSDDGFSAYFAALDKKSEKIKLLRVFDKTLTFSLQQPEIFVELARDFSPHGGYGQLPIHESGIYDDFVYQVMPFTKIESLEKLVDSGYIWGPIQALDLIYELLLSLDEAYIATKIGHFSLTPRNIFINEKGDILYNDFGIATHLLQDQRFVKSQMQVFDIYYISPEITYSSKFPNEACDVYSLGMLLYYLITGITPHSTPSGEFNPSELVIPKRVEVELDEDFLFILKNISKREPIQRMNSYRQVLKMIETYYENIGHSYTKQMSGEKTEVYEKKDFYKLVAPYLNVASSAASTAYNIKPLSSEAIQDRIKTSVDLGISNEVHQKLTNPKRVNKKRTNADIKKTTRNKKHKTPPSVAPPTTPTAPEKRSNQRPIQNKRRARQQVKKESPVAAIICSIVFLLAIVGGAIFIFTKHSNKDQQLLADIPPTQKAETKEDIPTPENTPLANIEDTDSAIVTDETAKDLPLTTPLGSIDPPITPEPEKPKTLKLERSWYLDALKEAEPDFTGIDERFKSDQENAAEGQTNTINFISNEINEAKSNAVRRIIIELRSEVNTLMFKKQYTDAINLYKNYDGPLKEESLESRNSLMSDLQTIIQDKLASGSEEKYSPISLEELKDHEITEQKDFLVSAIFKLDTIMIDEYIQKLSNLENIDKIKKNIELINTDELESNILNNIALSNNEKFELTINGKSLSAKVLSCDLDEKTIQVLSSFQGKTLKQSVKIKSFNLEDQVKHLKFSSDNQTYFSRFIYCLMNNNKLKAAEQISVYTGPLAPELVLKINKEIDLQVESKSMAILKVFNIINEDDVTANKLSENDAISLKTLLNALINDFKNTTYIQDPECVINLVNLKLNNFIKTDYQKDIFVGPSSQDKYPHLKTITMTKNTIRLLPGNYNDSIIVKGKKVKFIGSQAVKIHNSIIVSGSDIILSQLNFQDGEINIDSDSDNILIDNCFLDNGGINSSGKSSDIIIRNSFLRFVKSSLSTQKIQILHSTICSREKDSSPLLINLNKSLINDSILHAGKNPILSSSAKEASVKLKNSLLSNSGPLAIVKNLQIYSLEELDDNVSDLKDSLKDNVSFKDPKAKDYRIKDFSPGFNAASDKKSMGATFSESLHLRGDLR
ncbi:protein kinase [Lentisphaera marina]|uniref:protein kinase domain-containing protein n=1 Tax=Lentisphaera marina TaxID=1111041 RepID=UPI00236616F6|nr:protein kinase [Lentisphaera marina]MDD7986857.1 protein kinase [Lentisphaera marina]